MQDNAGDARISYAIAGGNLSLSLHGNSDNYPGGIRGTSPFLYRKLPTISSPGATMIVPIVETYVDCSSVFKIHSQGKCGIVVYHAGKDGICIRCLSSLH
jgi:hypothetical protein